MWKLTIEDDEGKQTGLPLAHEEYTLGRGESNSIRLTDRNVSRQHFKSTARALYGFLPARPAMAINCCVQ